MSPPGFFPGDGPVDELQLLADHVEERPCEERRATVVQLTSRHRSSADEAGSRAGGGAGKPQGPAGEGARPAVTIRGRPGLPAAELGCCEPNPCRYGDISMPVPTNAGAAGSDKRYSCYHASCYPDNVVSRSANTTGILALCMAGHESQRAGAAVRWQDRRQFESECDGPVHAHGATPYLPQEPERLARTPLSQRR